MTLLDYVIVFIISLIIYLLLEIGMVVFLGVWCIITMGVVWEKVCRKVNDEIRN